MSRCCLWRKLVKNGRLSGTGAPPSLAWRVNGPGVGVGVGEVDPAINYAENCQALGRVPATLRRASKRWTSSSRSALVAPARGTSVPARWRVRSATCRASTQVAAYSGVADETHWIDLSGLHRPAAASPLAGKARLLTAGVS